MHMQICMHVHVYVCVSCLKCWLVLLLNGIVVVPIWGLDWCCVVGSVGISVTTMIMSYVNRD